MSATSSRRNGQTVGYGGARGDCEGKRYAKKLPVEPRATCPTATGSEIGSCRTPAAVASEAALVAFHHEHGAGDKKCVVDWVSSAVTRDCMAMQ